MRVAAFTLLSMLAVGGCTQVLTALYRPPRVPECEAVIPASTSLTEDFVRRLRLHIVANGVSEGFEVIAQGRHGELTLVGLTRFGAKAFTIVHSGDEIRVVSFVEAIETVPPANILADIYRWPLAGDMRDESAVEVHVSADGRSAVIVHQRCGYRTTIFDLTNDDGD